MFILNGMSVLKFTYAKFCFQSEFMILKGINEKSSFWMTFVQ